MAKPLYRGYSSFEFQKNKSFRLNNTEAVKIDLLNHIFTRRGERVMMPGFGTSIPDLTFEPLDDDTIELIQDELRTVFDYDPRVETLEIRVDPIYDQNAIYVYVRLEFIELNIVDNFDFRIEFENFVGV